MNELAIQRIKETTCALVPSLLDKKAAVADLAKSVSSKKFELQKLEEELESAKTEYDDEFEALCELISMTDMEENMRDSVQRVRDGLRITSLTKEQGQQLGNFASDILKAFDPAYADTPGKAVPQNAKNS